MKKLILLLQLIGSLQMLYAQSNLVNSLENIGNTDQLFREMEAAPKDADSLKHLLTANINNETRALVLFQLTTSYIETNLDSSLKYIKLFNELPAKSKVLEANGMNIMGDIFLRLGNASMGLENLFKSVKIHEEMKDTAGMGMAYWNLGKIYQSLGSSATATSYYLNSIKIAAAKPVPLCFSMGHLGLLYLELNRLDSALYYTQSAYNARSANTGYGPILLTQLGDIYKENGDFNLAMKHYRMALDEAPAYHHSAASRACMGIAALFKKDNKTDSCYYYAKQGLIRAQRLQNADLISKTSKFLKDFFKDNNRFDSAFRYQEIMIAANDSMRSLERINKVHDISFGEQQRVAEVKSRQKEFQNKIKQYVLISSVVVFIIIAALLYRNNRHKQKANTLLQQQKQEIQRTLTELKMTQAQLIQSEKMASLGELTAGIAHEIQNPLNFVNNFSELNRELIEEMKTELASHSYRNGNLESVTEIADNIKDNSEKINHHGKRADAIVKGMLQHSRTGSGLKEATDINALADEYLRLSYHGLRARDNSLNATIKTDYDESAGKINIIPQDIGRVLLNLYNNAFYAVKEKAASCGLRAVSYEPTVTVSTKKLGDRVEIRVEDNGNGIPQNIIDKILQPFFTTKPTGQGTGLGLSLSYDIVKAHGGEIKVESKEGEGSRFIILLPL